MQPVWNVCSSCVHRFGRQLLSHFEFVRVSVRTVSTFWIYFYLLNLEYVLCILILLRLTIVGLFGEITSKTQQLLTYFGFIRSNIISRHIDALVTYGNSSVHFMFYILSIIDGILERNFSSLWIFKCVPHRLNYSIYVIIIQEFMLWSYETVHYISHPNSNSICHEKTVSYIALPTYIYIH